MNKLITLLLALVLVASTAKAADMSLLTGAKQVVTDRQHYYGAIYFSGYVNAMAIQTYTGYGHCIPRTYVTKNDVSPTVVTNVAAYIVNNRDKHMLGNTRLIVAALKAVYPCQST